MDLREEGKFVSAWYFFWIIPLILQATLIQYSSTFAKRGRLLLTFPTVYYALIAPSLFAFEPRDVSVAVNAVIGVTGIVIAWTSLELGFAQNEKLYQWVGFKKEKEDSVDAARDVATKSIPHAVVAGVHLLLAVRGPGYGFSGNAYNRTPRRTIPQLLGSTLQTLIITHILFTLTAIIISASPVNLAYYLNAIPFIPFDLSSSVFRIKFAATGLAAYSGLNLGYSVLTLIFLASHQLILIISSLLCLPSRFCPQSIDTREYPPLILPPWSAYSVTSFWSKTWHAIFAQNFRFLAYEPILRLFGQGSGKSVGKIVGTLAVFALSALMHEFGIRSATSHLSLPPADFLVRHGGSIYFMTSGVAVVLEGLFTAITGRKVRGFWGGSFAIFVVGSLGGVLSESWFHQGLFTGLTPVELWSWERFVIPLACYLPPCVWTKLVIG